MNRSYHTRNPSFDRYNDEEAPVPRIAKQVFRATIAYIYQQILDLYSLAFQIHKLFSLLLERPVPTSKHVAKWLLRQLSTIPSVLVIVWLFVLLRGESFVFDQSLASCDWSQWESWPSRAAPHRIAFVADPQLVDPHTYPGRPWPLSTFTIRHTDLYLRRSYSRIQRDLEPNSILFLGDLFDGGREWSTQTSESLDERYHEYGEPFWQKEYRRFSNIFFREWRSNPGKQFRPEELVENTRIIASLPGNHDLGFGATIQIPVRDRFNAFFGESNRVDVIGNHTFVSLDTVSLSARDQQGSDPAIYRPTEEFLDRANQLAEHTEKNHIRYISGLVDDGHRRRTLEDASAVSKRSGNEDDSKTPLAGSHFPTILLTHVPLHRPQGTPCGPLREKYPPTRPPRGQTEPVFPDDRNSLRVDGFGWQYQNAITQGTSHYILDKLHGRVANAFSGDDHDYCDVVHHSYPNPGSGIREITVKSISWAMGVRRPGFLLASLWHELDEQGKPVARAAGEDTRTIQTHLCLLPDQLAVFISYIVTFGLTLVALLSRAVYVACGPPQPASAADASLPLLPMHSPLPDTSAEREKLARTRDAAATAALGHGTSTSNSSADGVPAGRAAPRVRASAQGLFPVVVAQDNPLDVKRSDGYFAARDGGAAARRPLDTRRPATFSRVFFGELWTVVRVVLPVYVLLWWW